jgi:uncharacterized protein
MLSRYLPVFIILSLIAEILGTVGGFGSSVFFVPIANFFLDFQAVLGITALYHVSSNITKIAFFRKGLDRGIILNLGVPAVLFVIIGGFASKYLNPTTLTYVLGIFLVIISLVFLIFKRLVVQPTRKNAIAGGVLSGLSAGILGTGGAIRGITLAAFKMNKSKFIATSAIIDLGVDLSRTIVYYYNGYIRKDLLYLIPILIVIGIIGTWMGKRILNRISQEQFRFIVLLLILGIGLASIVSNISTN